MLVQEENAQLRKSKAGKLTKPGRRSHVSRACLWMTFLFPKGLLRARYLLQYSSEECLPVAFAYLLFTTITSQPCRATILRRLRLRSIFRQH